MPTIPGRIVGALGQRMMLRLNELWARGQMALRRWLYDLGPGGRLDPSPYYTMEVRVTRDYPFVTHLAGWGLYGSRLWRLL